MNDESTMYRYRQRSNDTDTTPECTHMYRPVATLSQQRACRAVEDSVSASPFHLLAILGANQSSCIGCGGVYNGGSRFGVGDHCGGIDFIEDDGVDVLRCWWMVFW